MGCVKPLIGLGGCQSYAFIIMWSVMICGMRRKSQCLHSCKMWDLQMRIKYSEILGPVEKDAVIPAPRTEVQVTEKTGIVLYATKVFDKCCKCKYSLKSL